MARKKKRKWDDLIHADDPAAGLLNLFDVWIAFAAALLLASLSFGHLSSAVTRQGVEDKKVSPAEMEKIGKQFQQLMHYRVSAEKAGGDGERLGVAYRLKTGEVIYVPEEKQ